MQLRYSDILELNAGLNEFEPLAKPILNDKRERVGTEKEIPYKISWKVVYAAARTRSALRDHVDAFEKTRSAIVEESTDGSADIQPNHPKYRECLKKISELLATPVEVEIHKVKLDELNTDTNSYPPSMITRLLPWIIAP